MFALEAVTSPVAITEPVMFKLPVSVAPPAACTSKIELPEASVTLKISPDVESCTSNKRPLSPVTENTDEPEP